MHSSSRVIVPDASVIADQFRSSTLTRPPKKVFSICNGSRCTLNSKFISSSPMQAATVVSTCASSSPPRPAWPKTTSMTDWPARSSCSRIVFRKSEYSGWMRPSPCSVRMPCGIACSIEWMSAVFWRMTSELCWIFSTIVLNASIDLPISSIRFTGTRSVKSWLVAISLILTCISPTGRTICRYSMKPMPQSSSTAPVVTAVSVACVRLMSLLSEAMAASLLRFFSTCSVRITSPCSRRYWSTLPAMLASANSLRPASLNLAVASMASK